MKKCFEFIFYTDYQGGSHYFLFGIDYRCIIKPALHICLLGFHVVIVIK